jgi:hypothetical protein
MSTSVTNPEGKDNLENLGIDGGIILEYIFTERNGVAVTF